MAKADKMRQYLRAVTLRRDEIERLDVYPFSIPAIRNLEGIDFHPSVTFFVGENGSGKSTLIEGIAIALGFNAEGGSKNFNFSTRSSESSLHRYLRPVRGVLRPQDGFFLRAESYFNVGSEIEKLDGSAAGPLIDAYGGTSVHEQSHGESFLALVQNRFRGHGLYILDEPEAALSPSRQLTFLSLLHGLVKSRSAQFIIATHSPIIMAYPDALILCLDEHGIEQMAYEDTEHYRVTKDFLTSPQSFLKHLLAEDE